MANYSKNSLTYSSNKNKSLHSNTQTKGKSDPILLVNSMSSLIKCLSQKYMLPYITRTHNLLLPIIVWLTIFTKY